MGIPIEVIRLYRTSEGKPFYSGEKTLDYDAALAYASEKLPPLVKEACQNLREQLKTLPYVDMPIEEKKSVGNELRILSRGEKTVPNIWLHGCAKFILKQQAYETQNSNSRSR